jgi:hypothetical protein
MPPEFLERPSGSHTPTIQLYDNETQILLGEVTEQQLQFLIDHLEEESSTDQDYYINSDTLEMFARAGADTLPTKWQTWC